MNPLLLSNRQTSESGQTWFHIIPKGEFEHPTGLVQVLDDQATEAIVNRFNQDAARPNFSGLLLDQEHYSYDPEKPSTAFGWIKELSNREDGVWGRIELTTVGIEAVEGRTYKYLSPAFLPTDIERLENKRVRPLRLDSVGLTNVPNMKGMVPLANRATLPERLLARQLGVKETDANALVEGVTVLKNRIAALEGQVQKFQEADQERQIEEDLRPLKRRPELMASFRALLLANRAAALPVIKKVSEELNEELGADLEPLANRANPKIIEGFRTLLLSNRDAVLPILTAYVAIIDRLAPGKPMVNRAAAGIPSYAPLSNRGRSFEPEVRRIMKERNLSYRTAFTVLRQEQPGLFPEADRED